jgi:hypothetical protein
VKINNEAAVIFQYWREVEGDRTEFFPSLSRIAASDREMWHAHACIAPQFGAQVIHS